MKMLITVCTLLFLLAAGFAQAAPMTPDMADLAAKLLPSVVSIASTEPVIDRSDNGGDPDDQDGQDDGGGQGSAFHLQRTAATSSALDSVLPPPKAEEALGSGFVFDQAGFILTNNHVIDGATSVTVTFADGTILPARVVGRDKAGDLAVLKVDAGHSLPAVSFGDSSKLRVGDWVLAIGNPFGLSGSASAGIVSALDRNISENAYDDFIQTDATINRGNSGGPLFNMAGQVIGVNAAIYSPSGGSVGIGFAIPAAMAAPVAQSLKTTGAITRSWLGISAEEVTPDIQKLLSLPDTDGALIGGTSPASPADGKLQPGDVLVSLAGVAIKDPRGLMIRTAEIPAGQQAAARFWRDGSLQEAMLKMAAPPAALDDTERAPPVAPPGNVVIGLIGLSVASVPTGEGLTVVAVTPGGPAGKAGLVADNVIEQVGGAPVGSPDDLQTAVKKLAVANQPVAVLLVSGDAADGSDPGPRWVPVLLKIK